MALLAVSSTISAPAFHKQSLVLQSRSGFASGDSFAKTPNNNKNGIVRFPVNRNSAVVCLRAQSNDNNATDRPNTMKKKKENKDGDEGIFAPTVVVLRNVIGKKRFNQLRGKAIALHSQVITDFCNYIGADSKQRQGLILLTKKNGQKLGFLA